MPRVVYKNKVLNIDRDGNESDHDFHIRKWFILKNIPSKILCDMVVTDSISVTLIALSKIYLMRIRYGCAYDEDTLQKIMESEKNLYIY
jgi:hypothetical protein